MYAGQNRREHDKDTTTTTAVTAIATRDDSIHLVVAEGSSSSTNDNSTFIESAPSDAPTEHTTTATLTNTDCTTKPKSYKHKSHNTNTNNTNNEVKRDIFENFKSYGLAPPELIRLDNHLCDKHYYVNSTRHKSDPSYSSSSQFSTGYFDLICTDPPYGIRAGAKKCGK